MLGSVPVDTIYIRCRHHWRPQLQADQFYSEPMILCIYRKVPFDAGFIAYYYPLYKLRYLFFQKQATQNHLGVIKSGQKLQKIGLTI